MATKPFTYTDEMIDDAVRLRIDEDLGYADIARLLGGDAGTISRRIRAKLGFRPDGEKYKKWTREQHDTLVEMAQDGCEAPEIAERVGRTESQVRHYAYKRGIKIASAAADIITGLCAPVVGPAPPYRSPDEFPAIDFRAPRGAALKGVAKPIRAPGRIGLPPRPTAVGAVSSLGAIARSG